MMYLASALAFGAALIAVAISAWVPPKVPLGRPFWILTFLLIGLPLMLLIFFALASSASPEAGAILIFGISIIFGPVAAGWLVGVLVSAAVRFLRMKLR